MLDSLAMETVAFAVVAQRRKINAGLSFAGPAGASVIEENELVDISSKVKLDDMLTLGKALETYGPVIVTGKFAFSTKWATPL